jgi:hypothetical protein
VLGSRIKRETNLPRSTFAALSEHVAENAAVFPDLSAAATEKLIDDVLQAVWHSAPLGSLSR